MKKITISIILLFSSKIAICQVGDINLAKNINEPQTITVNSNTAFTVSLKNRLLNSNYTYSWEELMEYFPMFWPDVYYKVKWGKGHKVARLQYMFLDNSELKESLVGEQKLTKVKFQKKNI